MLNIKPLKFLSVLFFIGGLYDISGGVYYLFFIGIGRAVDNPPVHPFYSIFIASFLFCFAYLQLLSSFNIKRYIFNMGCLIFGRIFYAALLFAYTIFVADFPNTFLITGFIDITLSILYIILTLKSDEVRLMDLFLPYRKDV